MKRLIAVWQEENKYFVRTKAVDDILKSLKENHVCCITGNSGIGKSASMHHVALDLQEKQEFQIFQCYNPSDICKYFKEGKKQIFLFDDVCGKYTLVQNNIEECIKLKDDIKTDIILGDNTKILVTSRSQIVFEQQFKRINIFQDKHCDLSGEVFSLSHEMKLQIAKQYLPTDVLDSIKGDLDKYELLPLMFSLYKSLSATRTIVNARNFFQNPFDQYINELNELKNAKDKTKFCALFLVVVNNGFVDASVFTGDESSQVRSIRKNIFEACGVNRGKPRERIQEQLDAFLDFFLKKSPTCAGYTTIHDKMFDVLCNYFGKHFQVPCIRYVDSQVFCQRTQLKLNDDHRFVNQILILPENEGEVMKRIVRDLLLGKACDDYLYHYHYKTGYHEYILKLTNFIGNLDVDKVKQLISVTERNGCSLLSLSCQTLDIDKVKFFIEKGANVNPNIEQSNETPLTAIFNSIFISSWYDKGEVLKLLIEHGANVNKIVRGSYPLASFLENLKDLWSYGFKQEASNALARDILELLIDNGHNINTVYKYIHHLFSEQMQGFPLSKDSKKGLLGKFSRSVLYISNVGDR